MPGVLYGPNNQPISSKDFDNKKADPPKTGAAFGNWAGRDIQYASLPGGGVIQFDLSKLELSDFRQMRDHYQINSSLAVLSFMQHQSDFHVECEDKRVADFCETMLRDIWTQLNRSMSQSNWAGYSPNALEWENNLDNRSVDLVKIKDLVPEECEVNWKEVPGWAPPGRTPPKFKVYDGIKQFGMGWPIPTDNSFWYPLLMENGDYYGRKLLRPAFTSWFFSLLIHLFANRYYERFGEPTPIGRAPFDDDLEITDNSTGVTNSTRGNQFMLELLQQLRSRSVVVLPNDHTQTSQSGTPIYDYDIEYLESQMRGADFERYLTRLDEEMSIGLFTPILLLRTADVGSYNLGVGHMQMYLWMLNAMNDDRAQYIDRYLLWPMTKYNFSEKAPKPKIKFRKLGNANVEMIAALIEALVSAGKIKPDVRELGQIAGMTLTEIQQTVKPPPAPNDPNADPTQQQQQTNLTESAATASEMVSRVRSQIDNAFRNHTFGDRPKIDLGYKRKFERALAADGIENAVSVANEFYGRMDRWLVDAVALGEREFSGPDSFMGLFTKVLDGELERLTSAS